jgi:hypothetical protein
MLPSRGERRTLISFGGFLVMRFHVLPTFALALLAFGCEGGQTGDLSGNTKDGNETGGYNGCEEHRQKLGSLDEMTDYGSAEQVLAFAERSFDAPLTWRAPRDGASWSAGPESGASSIHIDVVRGESAYLLTYETKPNEDGSEIGLGCPSPQLGVEAHVTVTTEGGALSESFDTLIRSQGAHLATFSVGLDLTKLDGELAVSYSTPNAKLVQVSLNATLMAEGTTGSLGGIEQVEHGEVVSAGQAVLAVWPDAPACSAGQSYQDGSGIGVAADANALGITGNAAAELISGMTPVGVAWLDGSSTELTVTTELLGDGCLRASNPGYGQEAGGTVTYPARFGVVSADGRVNGEYTGTLVSYPEGDAHGVTANAFQDLTLEQVAQSGFAGAEVPSGVERLRVSFEARHVGVVAEGSLRLQGVSDPPCLTEPQPEPGGGMSVPGCAGSMVTAIESATW